MIRCEIFKAVCNTFNLFEGKVLDSGRVSMPYKELILSNPKITEYVGLDIQSALNYEDVKADFLWDGIEMPFDNESFDVIISTEVLEHVPNPDLYLQEVMRVLKPGGIFFFTVPFLQSLHEVHNDYYRYTPFALEMIFKRNGFIDIKINPMGGFHAAMVQMIGLLVNIYLWGRKKKFVEIIAKPIMKLLYDNDKIPLHFKKSTMIVGLSGPVIKPI